MNLYEVKEKVIDFLKQSGFDEPDRAYYIVRDLLDKAPDCPDYVLNLLNACSESYDPDNCLLNFSHFIDHSFSPYSQLKEFNQNELLLEVCKTIFSASNYLSSLLFVQPAFLYSLFEGEFLEIPGPEQYYQETIRMEADLKDDNVFSDGMNRFKIEKLVPIALREMFNRDPINITARHLSVLADTILKSIYRHCLKKFPGQRLAIISLGKLGGGEVNFSSDLDLIFIGDEQNNTMADEFGQLIISELSRRSRYGYLFRVDMRLRPEGHVSPIVTRLDYLRNYLDNRARTWERQAYIRARFSAGDLELGEEAIRIMREFVYHSSLTIEDIRSIIFIKNEIDYSVKSNPLGHVKKGRGGIRDIEFIVQAFQLIFGYNIPTLRQSNIFRVLEMLYEFDLIPLEEYEVLADGYRFLRRIEHYLQLRDNRQVFELPKKDKDMKVLIRLMGFSEVNDFKSRYSHIRERIRKIFTKVFSRIFGEGTIADVGQVVINPDIDPDTAAEILSQYRFKDPMNIYKYLRKLAERSPKISISLALSLHIILSETEKYPDPDKKFLAFISVMESYGAIATFLKLIRERRQWKNVILNVIAESENLTQIVLDSPGIIDQLIDPDLFNNPETPEQIFRRFEEMYGGEALPAILKLKNHQYFLTAVREICGIIDSEEAGYILSDTVDFLIRHIAHQFESEIQGDYAILALGRLGCREVTFGSDADVVYVFRDSAEMIKEYTEFFNSIPQYLRKIIEVDARLRPNGKNAPLAITDSGFFDYLKNNADLWERSAYMKCRIVRCSNDELFQEVNRHVHEFVMNGNVNEDLRKILDLRAKIHKAYSKTGKFHIKKDSGGLMDIDFIVFMKIREQKIENWNHSMLHNLSILGETDSFERSARKLLTIYKFYRKLENVIRVDYAHLGSIIDWNNEDFLRLIVRKLGMDSSAELKTLIETYRGIVSKHFEKE